LKNNKKSRKTSIDIYPNYIKTENNPQIIKVDTIDYNDDFYRIRKNLIKNYVDFPENSEEKENQESHEVDEYLNLGMKSKKKFKYFNNNKKINNTSNQLISNINQDLEKTNSDYLIKKEFIENISEEKTQKKKKISLLRRTTSVPKINNLEESIEKDDRTIIKIKNKLEIKISNSSDSNDKPMNKKKKYITNTTKNDNKFDLFAKKSNSLIKGDKNKNEKEIYFENDLEYMNELNSPNNELFFYVFENILEEYMKKKIC